jgi:hypothetical protein
MAQLLFQALEELCPARENGIAGGFLHGGEMKRFE